MTPWSPTLKTGQMNGDTGIMTNDLQSVVDCWFSSGPGGGDWPSLYEPGEDLETEKYLTKSETRVASGYTCGLIGKEIADTIGISHNTVVRHTQNIYEKTGIPHSTNALVAWFLSVNYKIDLREFRRRMMAVSLFLVISGQIVVSDFSNQIVRRFPTRKVELRQRTRRRGRENNDTYYL